MMFPNVERDLKIHASGIKTIIIKSSNYS